jgi:hypothetical protein
MGDDDDLMMLGHVRPGDLFFMTEVGSRAWFTCIAIRHYEDPLGIPTSLVTLLTPECRIVQTHHRSAKEVCVPPGMGREWKEWDVEP